MSHPTPPSYRPDIDGLRGLAVLMVVLFHAGFGFKGGYVGVDIFFVISGYLITGLLFKEMARGRIDLAGFWERRLRRIAPALTVMLLVTLAAGSFLLLPTAFASLGESVAAQALLSANIYFWRDSGYFAAASEEKPLLHLWSLAVEEQFYLLLPVVFIFAQWWMQKKHSSAQIQTRLVLGLAIVLMISLITSCITVWKAPNATFYWLPTRAWELLVGSLLAGLPASWRLRHRWQQETAATLALLLIGLAAFGYESDTPFPGATALLPCLGAAGLIWAHSRRLDLSGDTGRMPRSWSLMTWPPLVGIGLISYSLYLWHWPLLAFAQYLNVSGNATPSATVRVGLVIIALILAWLSWRWVETPFRKKALLDTRPKVFIAGIGSALMFAFVGWQMARLEGMPGRMPLATVRFAQGADDKRPGDLWTDLAEAQAGKFPRFGQTQGQTSIMLWGDSHARSLLPVLDSLCNENQVAGEAALYSATAPLIGFHRRSRHGLNERTELLSQAVLKQVREKQIPHTVVAAYWKECPGREPDKFSQALLETVRALRSTGTQVWVVLDVPSQPFDVPKALALGKLAGGLFPDATTRSVTVEEHRKANAVMQALISQLQDAGAQVLDPVERLAEISGRTTLESQDKAYYSDAHHLSITGAMALRPLFQQLFPVSKTQR